ncbi:MAG TPA: FIST N-terminal domain-containing protein [Solirubrobacteraceae bacterium]|nr:FIST N-terminal domain-containing protein [Solirubrobacteraceae bacterium]
MAVPSTSAARPGHQRERWLEVGHSAHPHARTAGREAAALARGAGDAKLLIVFCSGAYDLDELLAGIGESAAGVPLIGCSTAGEIATGGPEDHSVVVVTLGGPGFSVQTGAARRASADLREAGAVVAQAARAVSHCAHRVLMLLSDGLAGDQQEVVRGAYGVLGAEVPLVGGCAGDDLQMTKTFQLHDGRVLCDAVVGVAIGSDAPLGIGVRHGWRRVGEPMVATRSAGNRVYELDDQPALDVYLDHLDAPPEARLDAAAFTRFALTHPLGLARRRGEEHVRFVGDADFAERSLGLIAEVPQGGLAWFMEGDDDSVLAATDAACTDALEQLRGSAPLGMIAFDCIARRGVLGDSGIATEVARVALNAGGAPVAGFYTYGEIARTRGVSGFHNQTLVVLAVG